MAALETTRSSERDELGTSGGTVSDFTMTNWLVGHGVLTDEITDHVSLDLNLGPVLASVDSCDGSNHLWHDDSVTKMCLDCLGLITELSVLG